MVSTSLWDTSRSMEDRLSRVIIVGGGGADWLAAGVIATEHRIAHKIPINSGGAQNAPLFEFGFGFGFGFGQGY